MAALRHLGIGREDYVTQQGEAEARGRAEPHKEGQRRHAGFRVRADKEGEARAAKASETGLWGPGCPASPPPGVIDSPGRG